MMFLQFLFGGWFVTLGTFLGNNLVLQEQKLLWLFYPILGSDYRSFVYRAYRRSFF